jgi:hypothetical protein
MMPRRLNGFDRPEPRQMPLRQASREVFFFKRAIHLFLPLQIGNKKWSM